MGDPADRGEQIPILDAGPLLGPDGPARRALDDAVLRAATRSGFMTLVGVPAAARLDPEVRSLLLRVLDLPAASKRPLYRQRYEPGNPNRYRGLAPLRPQQGIGTESIEFGPDAVEPGRGDPDDLLCEPSVWPEESELPGFRARLSGAFAGLEELGLAVVASLERGLGLEPGRLVRCFEGGNSTLRLVRHPGPGELPEAVCRALAVDDGSPGVLQLVLPHSDSGCVTFVSQDEQQGLQARGRDGRWVRVPAPDGGLAVNFGHLLELWTGGAIRATEHRVVGRLARRSSIPFFFEPAVDARIEPLPGAPAFEPVLYGDYLWSRMRSFPDYRGLEGRRARSAG